jgi:hypothetical protein
MKTIILLPFFALLSCIGVCQTPDVAGSAKAFLALLTPDAQGTAQFKFEDEERVNWHFVPRWRAGVPIHELNQPQFDAAITLLKASLSVQGFKKATDIISLENVLREIENRSSDDTYRDPRKYYFSIFGTPSANTPWGWRLEGHHLALNFTSVNNEIESSTPSFFGSNPATIPAGKRKGEQVLKEESDLAFSLVNALSAAQLKSAMISETAFPDILSYNKRTAAALNPKGIVYTDLNEQQKKVFMTLLDAYIKNYELGFGSKLMKKIRQAGIENLTFAWAGSLKPGKGHYYRIQGPTLLIEFDNTQDKANHIHSVVRDLTNDFADDILKEHYAKEHSKK